MNMTDKTDKTDNKDNMENVTEQQLAFERTELSHERTKLSIMRTRLAVHNSRLSVEQTHLAFLRTIVSLMGSAATIYTALPVLGVSDLVSTTIAVFLFGAALYFIIKDRMTYPVLKNEVDEIARMAKEYELEGDDDL